jgi:hypothetical protein
MISKHEAGEMDTGGPKGRGEQPQTFSRAYEHGPLQCPWSKEN